MLLFLYFFLDKFFIHSLLVTLKLVTFKWHFDFQILAIINSRDLLFKSGTKNFTIYVTYSSFKVSYYHYCDYHSIVIFTFIIIKCIIIIVTNYFIVAIVIITDTCLAIISLNFLSIFFVIFFLQRHKTPLNEFNFSFLKRAPPFLFCIYVRLLKARLKTQLEFCDGFAQALSAISKTKLDISGR